MIGLSADDKKITLLYDLPYNLPSQLYSDELRLRQVLVNLANNAVKFTDPGGTVILSARNSGPSEDTVIHFSVTDTGIGIP